ncbi:MAG: nicotinate-nucleotide adenylyltransferase [Eubacterium sp.]|nr:nicotinate-nucleotide adenylyltransferase [Eubacterium sp.]MDD7210165.1 nicotinate-nucleotide adenylyltransferase [Lachnospiraceae bacterium]MDY5497444.1 nicotinate-nucleotide adenylyltransferase [Anaerobutyricum sp.]
MTEHKKIGIMGGTFNPIHFGHLLLAETAFHQFQLDEILIMPTKNPYYKKISNSVTEEDRVRMVELAIEDNPHFHLSTEELDREGATYTVETLSHLTRNHPNCSYYFIMGADSLYHIESWKQPEEILRMATIVVAGRAGTGSSLNSQIEYIENKYEATIFRLNSPVLEISSNDIRRRVEEGESIRYLLPANVEQYIKAHNLYCTDDTEEEKEERSIRV